MTTEIFVDEKYFGNERFGIVTVALESLKITPRKYSDNGMVIEVGSTWCLNVRQKLGTRNSKV